MERESVALRNDEKILVHRRNLEFIVPAIPFKDFFAIIDTEFQFIFQTENVTAIEAAQ